MTPDEIHAARRAAAALFATHAPAAHVVSSLSHALDDLERATAEVDRLRVVEAAGERLADVCRDVHFSEWTGDGYTIDDLGSAMDAWEAARREAGP